MGIGHGAGSDVAASAERPRLNVVRDEPARTPAPAPAPNVPLPRRLRRPSRRAVVRAVVQNASVEPRERGARSEAAAPVTLTSVAEVLLLPGDHAGDCYRVTLDVRSTRTEPVTLDVLGLELGDASMWTLPRQPVVRPGAQRLTLVAGGSVGEGRLTLSYELDGHRHDVSAVLPSRSA
jgi:hypothetical protein